MKEALKDLRTIIAKLHTEYPIMGLILEEWAKKHIVQVTAVERVDLALVMMNRDQDKFFEHLQINLLNNLGIDAAKNCAEVTSGVVSELASEYRAVMWVIK